MIGGSDEKQYSWKKKTDIYDKYRPTYHLDSISDALKYTGLDIGKSVIADVGSGTGILTRQLSKHKPKKLYAIDPDNDMIDMSKKKKTDATHIVGLSNKIELPDNSVDIITVGTALHWFEPDSTLKEFKRILKPSGYVMVFKITSGTKDRDKEIFDAEKAAWSQISNKKDASQPRYKWRFEDIADTYNIVRRTAYEPIKKEEYTQVMLSQSRSPPEGTTEYSKYKQLLSDIYDEFKPNRRKTTRVTIVQLQKP
jgi:ubiquinone/menaquinone biosynthesis C-methylase UbiE